MGKVLEFKSKGLKLIKDDIFAAVPYRVEYNDGLYISTVKGKVINMSTDLEELVLYTERVIGYFVSKGEEV